jgi:hypothetical protein
MLMNYFLEWVFGISGVALVVIFFSKLWELKRHKPVPILSLISLGDERVHKISNELSHTYTAWREKAEFFVNKQLPLYTKNYIQKTNTLIKDKVMKYTGDIRGSKLLKKREGISEYFQSLAEKREGRIDSTLDTTSESGLPARTTEAVQSGGE